MKPAPARPYSAWKFEVRIFTSSTASGLSVTSAPLLLPRLRLVTPSTVYSCWLLRAPLMLKLPTTFCTVEVVIVPPAMTPGMVLNRSAMLRPLSARSRSCLLVTRSERSADSDWICSRPVSASTVTVSAMSPTSSTKSPMLIADRVLRITLLFSMRLKPVSSAATE